MKALYENAIGRENGTLSRHVYHYLPISGYHSASIVAFAHGPFPSADRKLRYLHRRARFYLLYLIDTDEQP